MTRGGKIKQKTNKQSKLEQILTAKDLTTEEYEELSLKKKMGETTAEGTCRSRRSFGETSS